MVPVQAVQELGQVVQELQGVERHRLGAASMQPTIAEPSWLAQDVRVRQRPGNTMRMTSTEQLMQAR